MTVSTDTLTLPGGRRVDLYDGGEPAGSPIVMHHGTPSDATTFADWDQAWLEANGAPFRTVTAEQIVAAFGGLVPPVDQEVLVGGYADAMATALRRALAGGFDGWVDDDLAFTRPWGFEMNDIGVPVSVWQGDLDLMVPWAHGRWLADHIPTATARLVDGHGHLSLVTGYRDQILDDLTEARPVS